MHAATTGRKPHGHSKKKNRGSRGYRYRIALTHLIAVYKYVAHVSVTKSKNDRIENNVNQVMVLQKKIVN